MTVRDSALASHAGPRGSLPRRRRGRRRLPPQPRTVFEPSLLLADELLQATAPQ